MKKSYKFFSYQKGSWIHIRKIVSGTALIMLEKTIYIAIILLFVQYRFQNHWSDGKHNVKVWAEN